MNRVILCGRLTNDPEVTEAANDTLVAKFTLAVDRRGTKGEDKKTDFIRIVSFNSAAEFAESYFKKGMRVLVSGKIQTGSYKNSDGKTVYTTDVVSDELHFADGKKEDEKPGRKSRY